MVPEVKRETLSKREALSRATFPWAGAALRIARKEPAALARPKEPAALLPCVQEPAAHATRRHVFRCTGKPFNYTGTLNHQWDDSGPASNEKWKIYRATPTAQQMRKYITR